MQTLEIQQHVRHNFKVNIIDAAFFGFAAIGLASTVTVIPLFLNSLGASTVLIAIVGSIHPIGWQFPQLFTARYVARLSRFKPMVMVMTIHERWPMFGLAVIAMLMPIANPGLLIALAFIMLLIYSMGAGLAATAWQSMIGKIMPEEQRGAFFGAQSAIANLLGAVGVVVAGFVLEQLPSPLDFALCFGLAGIAMMISMWFLNRTREPAHQIAAPTEQMRLGWAKIREILTRDINFRWFLVARSLSSVAWVAAAFYTIHAINTFKVSETQTGILAGVMTISQTISNLAFGWLGDRWGHRTMLGLGGLLMAISAGLAAFAPDFSWFYLVYALAGAANATFWSIVITLTLEFGEGEEKPLYIGLANTLVAPVTLLAPIFGGIIAGQHGYHTAFLLSMIAGLLMAGVLFFGMYDPRFARLPAPIVATAPEG
jgi:MFS family permease